MSDIGFSIDTGTLALMAALFLAAMSLVAAPLFFVTRYKGRFWGLICAGVLTLVLIALCRDIFFKLVSNGQSWGDVWVLLVPLSLWLLPAGVMIALGHLARKRAGRRKTTMPA